MGHARMTFVRHVLSEQEAFTSATGEFTALMTQISLAANVIARELSQAGLVDRLGSTGSVNVQGEQVKKLDQWSNDVFVEMLRESGAACTLVSEEMEEPLHFAESCERGRYVVCFDPIDGSSNIDVNGIVGTIFSVLGRRSRESGHIPSDVLR